MKQLLLVLSAAFVFSACSIDPIEPRYDSRNKIVGHYNVEEYSETYNDYTHYSLRISKSTYAGEIYLNNFYAAGISVYGVVDYDKIRMPLQVVDGYEVEGVGTIYGNEITFSYRVKDLYNHSYSDFCKTTARFDY
jgi:hypothetical protein